MRPIYLNILLISIILSASTFCQAGNPSDINPLDYIDTRVGTAYATTNTAGLFGKGSEEHGQTVPAVGVPHGMTLWTPQTRDTEQKCIAPYYYTDSLFQGFRSSHWINGGCTQDYGSMTIAALSGKLRTSPLSRSTPFSHNTETARPDYYSVFLPAENIRTEMTGLSRSAIFRLTYGEDGKGHIVVNPNTDEGEGAIEFDPIKKEIRGYNPVHRIYQGWGDPAGFSGWFVIALPENLEITGYGTFHGDTIKEGQLETLKAPGIGVYVSFNAHKDVPVVIKAGNSFTSMNAAKANLLAEIPGWDFDIVRERSAAEWNRRLNTIRVEGGSEENLGKFYGALYRSSLLPRVVSDVDGAYCAFASNGKIMKMPEGHDYYDDFSMWDVYRTQLPLISLIDPERSGDMMNSLVLKGEQGGWMPIFPCWNSYTAAMIGDHCAVAIADAAAKGIRGFDLRKAYTLLRRNAFETPASFDDYADGMGRRALESYLKYGYIPLEDNVSEAFHIREQTSRTLEYSFDDFALAQIARTLGETEDYGILMQRSQNYRNVIDPTLGYANGRHADGTFASDTNPFSFNDAITEGAPCHYTWYVPHDTNGLVSTLGGKKITEEKLDSMFSSHRYWHGNEPCHQIAYLFNDVDSPAKTRKWARYIMDTEYQDSPGGLSGNDDAGQMSAWFVFSAMGFYPVCPSLPEYYCGAPLFKKITVNPEGGKPFTIESDYPSNPEEIREVSLNGQPLKNLRLPHSALTSASRLHFK